MFGSGKRPSTSVRSTATATIPEDASFRRHSLKHASSLDSETFEEQAVRFVLAGAPVRKFREGGRRKPHHVHLRMLGAGDAVAWHERETELDNLSDKLRIAQVLHADDALFGEEFSGEGYFDENTHEEQLSFSIVLKSGRTLFVLAGSTAEKECWVHGINAIVSRRCLSADLEAAARRQRAVAPQLEAELEAANGELNESSRARLRRDTPTRGRTTSLPRAFSLSSKRFLSFGAKDLSERSNPLEERSRGRPRAESAGAAAATGPFASLTLPDSPTRRRERGGAPAASVASATSAASSRTTATFDGLHPTDGVAIPINRHSLGYRPPPTPPRQHSGDAISPGGVERSHLGSVSRLTRWQQAMHRLNMEMHRSSSGSEWTSRASPATPMSAASPRSRIARGLWAAEEAAVAAAEASAARRRASPVAEEQAAATASAPLPPPSPRKSDVSPASISAPLPPPSHRASAEIDSPREPLPPPSAQTSSASLSGRAPSCPTGGGAAALRNESPTTTALRKSAALARRNSALTRGASDSAVVAPRLEKRRSAEAAAAWEAVKAEAAATGGGIDASAQLVADLRLLLQHSLGREAALLEKNLELHAKVAALEEERGSGAREQRRAEPEVSEQRGWLGFI